MYTSSRDRIQRLTTDGCWGQETLHSLLAKQTREQPDTLAVIDPPNKPALTGKHPSRLSFRELDQASDSLALQLIEWGVQANSRLMVQLPNCVELLVCFYAASKLGLVISPLPMQYAKHEIRQLASVFEPTLFVTCNRFKNTQPATVAKAALPAVPVLSIDDDLHCLQTTTVTATQHAVLVSRSAEINDPANRILSVCWTSGTTGTPKGVPRSANMWRASARATAIAGDYRIGERLLNPFPLVNMAAIAGFLFAGVERGCTLVLHHPLDPTLYLEQLQNEAIQFTIAPPALLNQLADKPALWESYDFSALRAVGSGSAPLAPSMIRTFEEVYGKPVINFYGSNEGLSLFATPVSVPDPVLRASHFPQYERADSRLSGAADRGMYSKVIDPDSGETLTASGAVGELCFAGPTMFDGYMGTDNTTVFTADGFFRSGDLVEITGPHSQFYRIVGRLKDIINRGGMKISAAELDTIIESHPEVREAAVCAYPDPILGEKVCACIAPATSDNPVTLDALNHYLSAQGLASFKHPERLLILDALPRNPMGKVVRSELQQRLRAANRATSATTREAEP